MKRRLLLPASSLICAVLVPLTRLTMLSFAGRSMNVPDMAKVLNHLRRDPVVKVTLL